MKSKGHKNILLGCFAAAIFLALLALPHQARATCNDCISTYRACMTNSLTPGLPWVPFNWFTGGPFRCVANRNSCLKGCGFNDCKKSCREAGKVEVDFCKQQFAETRCGIKDKACKRRARKLKKQCIKDARSEKRSCVKECRDERRDPSQQGELQASNFRVNVLGAEKSGMVKFQLIREQKTANCNKIKMIRVNDGQFPDYIMPTPLCSFTKELKVQVFRNLNCKNSTNQAVKFELFTVKHPSRTGPWQDWNNRGEQTVSVSSDLVCNSLKIGSTRVRIDPPPAACSMQGWWKLTTGIANMDGDWQFINAGSTRGQGRYSAKGPATKIKGIIHFGNGSGNATISANKAFSWALNNKVTCRGQINNSCSIVVGTCKGNGYKAPTYSFKLEKSNGPVNIEVQTSPAGKPKLPNSIVKTRTQPKHPGITYKPGPTIPAPPRW